MIQLEITDAIILPWKSLDDVELGYRERLVVSEDGITRWPGELVADGHFLAASCKFGEFPNNTADDFCPSTRRLIRALTDAGAKPNFKSKWGLNGPKVSFAFDISTEQTYAIYELFGLHGGREILIGVFCDALDSAILENIHNIDQTMYEVLTKCRVPLTRPPDRVAPTRNPIRINANECIR